MGELDHINGGQDSRTCSAPACVGTAHYGRAPHQTGPGNCCQYGNVGDGHTCAKQPGSVPLVSLGDRHYGETVAIPHVCDGCPCSICGHGKGLERWDGWAPGGNTAPDTNGAGIERSKLRESTGRPKGARNLHAKHPSSIARAFKQAGLDWKKDFAEAIKGNKRERIKLWLKLLPYMVTQANKSIKVKKWKGKASKAALVALEALEGKQ